MKKKKRNEKILHLDQFKNKNTGKRVIKRYIEDTS